MWQKSKPTNKPDETRYCCPFCITVIGKEDTGFHLYVNFKKGTFNCFRCNTGGTLARLKQFLNISGNKTQEVHTDLNTLRDRIKMLFVRKIPPPTELEVISWPILSGETPLAYEYMKDRGFTDAEMSRYNLHVGKTFTNPKTHRPEKKWAGRVIFPFYENGEVLYLIGRSYSGKDPKYINSEGSKDRVIYGIDSIKNGTCILCEGIISSIAAERSTGVSSIAILGKSISKFQLAKLRSKVHTVYVTLDGTKDVTRKFRDKFNRELLKTGFRVYEVVLPVDNDPDEMGPKFKGCFDEARKIFI